MSRILLSPWRTQPQYPAPIDRGAPINRGLVLLSPLGPSGGLTELVSGQYGSGVGGLANRIATPLGSYPRFSTGVYADLANPTAGITGSTPITIGFTFRQTSQAATYPCLMAWRPAGASYQFTVLVSAQVDYYFAVGPGAGGVGQTSNHASAALAINTDYACIITLSSGPDSNLNSSRRVWLNGFERAKNSDTSLGTYTDSVFRVGQRDGSATFQFDGGSGNFHIWNRVLTDNEAQAWTTNPFMTRQPLRRYWMASAAGSGAITGTAGIVITPAGTLTGAGALAGTAAETITPTGTLIGAGALAGTADIVITPTGALTGAGALAGVAAAAFDCTGTLTGASAGSIAGTADLAFGATGTLAGAGALAGMASMTFGADLTVAVEAATERRNFGGIGRPQVIGPKRRNYIVKGQRYFNLTIEELAAVVEQVTAKRKDVKVQVPNQKPKTVDAVTWQEVKPQAAPMFDDDEDVLLLL